MGMFEGLVGGFGKAYGAHQKESAARTAKQGELEQSILSRLLGSDNPQIQMRAMQAMMGSVGNKGKPKKGGVLGSFGETEPSPAFTSLFEHLRGMDTKGQPGRAAVAGTPATPDTVTNTEEAAGGGDGGSRTPTQTITMGDPGTPGTPEVAPTTPEPLFKTSQQRQLEAGQTDRAARTAELVKGGASPEEVRAGVHGVARMRTPQMRPQLIQEEGGQLMVDPATGETIAEYGAKPMSNSGAGNRLVVVDGKQILIDPQGNTIQEYGARPTTERAPTDNEGYLNAGAASEQIESAVLAQFGEMVMDNPLPQQRAEIQRAREELARKYGWQSYEELQRNAATRRGDVGMSAPPSAEQGISGQGESVDTQRATEIWQAGQSGKIPTPEEQDFLRQYLEMYRDQLEP